MNENKKVVKGLILNSAGFDNEKEIVEKFTQRINVPLISVIPHDKMIPLNELKGLTAIDHGCSKDTYDAYVQASEYILQEHDVNSNTPWDRKEFYEEMNSLYGY